MRPLKHTLMGDGCRIAWRCDGPEGAPVLLLSNSLGTTLDMWAPQMEAFVRNFRVLRYDSRGHGASDVPAGAYSIDRLGRDVIELLDSLGIARVHFCGLSKGGMVGQWLGFRAPERIGRLVLANTSPFMGPPPSWGQRIATVHAQGMAAVADGILDRWFTPSFQTCSKALVAPFRAMLLATNPHGYTGCCAAIRDMDMRPALPSIDLPTLVIAGNADPATPLEHAHDLANNIPGAHLHILAAAHLSNVEEPQGFARAVLEWFEYTDP